MLNELRIEKTAICGTPMDSILGVWRPFCVAFTAEVHIAALYRFLLSRSDSRLG